MLSARRCRDNRVRNGCNRICLLVFIWMTSTLWTAAASARIQRDAFITQPDRVEVLSEDVIRSESRKAWNTEYNFFSEPVAACLIGAYINEEFYFILDRAQDLARMLTISETANGEKYLYSIETLKGSGSGAFHWPESITISSNGNGSVYEVYVLDTGNNRVRKFRYTLGQWPPEDLGQIYGGAGEPGVGALDQPHDIDYCELYDDQMFTNDFVVVADTYNHRVLALSTTGDVLWTVGGTPGNGENEFQYPYAVTAIRASNDTDEAIVYVVDRGNDRIVKLYQNVDGTIHWSRVLDLSHTELGAPPSRPQPSGSRFDGISGLDDIQTDKQGKLSGVFVLDSSRGALLQFDYDLSDLLTVYHQFHYKGAPMYGLALGGNRLATIFPYTANNGAELFKLSVSIASMKPSPSEISIPLDYSSVAMAITAAGTLSVWVETQSGQHVADLQSNLYVYPSLHYAVWDGTRDAGTYVSPGDYRIRAEIHDRWGNAATRNCTVRVVDAPNAKILVQQNEVLYPDWSHDGKTIVFSGNGHVETLDLETQAVTNLTPGLDGIQYWPSWSPDGRFIAWSKKPGYVGNERYVYVMRSDGSNAVMVSDSTDGVIDVNPQWSPGGHWLSLVDQSSSEHNTIVGVALQDRALPAQPTRQVICDPWLGRDINMHSWSTDDENIVMTSGIAGDGVDVFYDGLTKQSPVQIPGYVNRYIPTVDWAVGRDVVLAVGGADAVDPYGRAFAFSPWLGDARPVAAADSVLYPLPGGSWSPDGTKFVLPLEGLASETLVEFDVERSDTGAFPAAMIVTPLPCDTVSGDVYLTGTVDNNYSVDDEQSTPLSTLSEFHVTWGEGHHPGSWSDGGLLVPNGIGGRGFNAIRDDTLAMWNTAFLRSGDYTVRLVATDGTDSNVVYLPLHVQHRTISVRENGGGDFDTIAAALSDAVGGDTVVVSQGTYGESVSVPDGVSLVAATDSVVIRPGNATGLTFSDHVAPCLVSGIVIENTQYWSIGRGIHIRNASPEFRNCTVRHCSSVTNGADAYGGGVYIEGPSSPRFVECEFEDNRAIDGGGIVIRGLSGAHPTARFEQCEFNGNNTIADQGGAAYIYYDTALDTSLVAPSFVDCDFVGNYAPGRGGAIYLFNCHMPILDRCTFSGNEVGGYRALIDGESSGLVMANCTVVDNMLLGQGYYNLVDVRSYSAVDTTIVIQSSLFAYNEDGVAVSSAVVNHTRAQNSDFWQNMSDDDSWLTPASWENINASPAFCDRASGDYGLEASSPCVGALRTQGHIGSHDIECVPLNYVRISGDTLASSDSVATTCPQGDAEVVRVWLSLDSLAVGRSVEASEIVMNKLYGSVSTFGAVTILADSGATEANGYSTTISHAAYGGSGRADVAAYLNGALLADSLITIRSADIDGDGNVAIEDYAVFGAAYPSPPQPYDARCDFNGDGYVDLADYSFFGIHFGHTALAGAGQVMAGRRSSEDGPEVAVDYSEDVPVLGATIGSATIRLENASPFDALILALPIASNALEYVKWIPDASSKLRTMCAAVTRRGVRTIVIGIVGAKGADYGSIDVGTVEFKVMGQETVTGDVLTLERLDVLYRNGTSGGSSAGPVATSHSEPTYKNALAQNYPNPFNPSTVISYSLAAAAKVRLSVYDVSGALVRVLVNDSKVPGVYRVGWDGRDNRGSSVASGVYFYRLSAGGFGSTKKMVLIR